MPPFQTPMVIVSVDAPSLPQTYDEVLMHFDGKVACPLTRAEARSLWQQFAWQDYAQDCITAEREAAKVALNAVMCASAVIELKLALSINAD